MKTKMKDGLTSEVDPVFFGVTCLLLISVLFTAKIMADGVLSQTDQASEFFSLPLPSP